MKIKVKDNSSIYRMMWAYQPETDTYKSWKLLDVTPYADQAVHNSRFWELFKIWCDNSGRKPTIDQYCEWRIAYSFDDDYDPEHANATGYPHLDDPRINEGVSDGFIPDEIPF